MAFDFLKKHGSIRLITIWFTAASILLIVNMGIAAWLGAIGMMARFVVPMLFMIGQFVLLFSFLSSTKTIEVYPGDKTAVAFGKDYFGNEYLVEAIRQWVSSLTPAGKTRLDKMGGQPINGILLEGPPGTGKTLLAMALANETHGAFFGLSGADFRAMFFGVSEMKMMRTYSKARNAAKQYGSSVVFIDEADSIGASRGGVTGGQTAGGMFSGGTGVLSKWLVELDGMRNTSRQDYFRNAMRRWLDLPLINPGVVLTIGATNRLAVLDPALTRPGRLDKIIRVDSPDKESRRKIIEGYLNKVSHDDTVDVAMLTDDLQGVTPAQIASAIQRSAPRYAINDSRAYITQSDIESALQEDLVGLENPVQNMDPIQKAQIATHEAGHAVAALIIRPWKRVTHASTIRRGAGIMGYVRDVELKEVYGMPLSYYEANIIVAMAGHVAVEEIMGEPWTGGSSDFDHVRGYLLAMAMSGQLGGIPQDPQDPFKNKEISENRDKKERELWEATEKLIHENKVMLMAFADALFERDELNSGEVYALAAKFMGEDK